MGQFFQKPDVLQQHGAARAGCEGVFVIDYRSTGVKFVSRSLDMVFLWVFRLAEVGLRRCKETRDALCEETMRASHDKSITIINIDNKDSLLSFINLLL